MEANPKPSIIPRPPRSTATRPAVQAQPSRLPPKFNVTVRKSRVAGVGDERRRLGFEAPVSQPEVWESDEAQLRDNFLAPVPTGTGEENETALEMTTETRAEAPNEGKVPDVRRRPRPSLSERTMETLSLIPPSPTPRRRKSSFYPTDMPGSSLPGPSSALTKSRSENTFSQSFLPSTPRRASPTKHQTDALPYSAKPSSVRRSVSSFVPKSLPRRSGGGVYGASDQTPSKVPPVPKLPPNSPKKSLNLGLSNSSSVRPGVGSNQPRQSLATQEDNRHDIGRHPLNAPKFRAQTYAPKSTRPRIPLDELFSRQTPDTPNGQNNRSVSGVHKLSTKPGSKGNAQERSTAPSREHPRVAKDRNESPALSSLDPSSKKSDSPKSSAALRETIAKAKEARRKAVKLGTNENVTNKKNFQAIDRDDVDIMGELSDHNILLKRMETGRTSGKLNIAALGLSEFPTCLKGMYNIENIDIDCGEWYESVDLVRLMAADNELEFLPSWAFPDMSLATDLEEGNIFGGLQLIDLHGNNLNELTSGLTSLTHLTNINLSRNRLTNTCMDVLGQLPSLRQLQLTKNLLEGPLHDSVGNLVNLELLDLQDNSITDLGPALREMTKLRNLAVAGNRLISIPSYVFESLFLDEINAARNRIAGSLIPEGLTNLAALRSLDVSRNALTAISESESLNLLSLQDLNITDNRICMIPDMSEWRSLINFCAGGNKLANLPEGLASLTKLKTLDVSRNDIKQLDSRLGLMDNLTALEVGNNPLRERRQLTMKTEDLKKELRARLPSTSELAAHGEEDVANTNGLVLAKKEESTWTMKPGGILDRSSTNLQALAESHLEPLLQTTDIKSMIFHHNRLSCIPTAALSLVQNTLTTLDLSHNNLTSETYLSSAVPPFSLPHLKSLDLSSNTITTLHPLTTDLHAPLLTLLNISYNRLTSLPSLPLRTTYPSLTTLLASNNSIEVLEVQAAQGLHVLDLSENAIERLDPRLGLLEKEEGGGGLRRLLVGGNRFRVPRREVLEKGTEGLLRWLRGRIPGVEGEGEGGAFEN